MMRYIFMLFIVIGLLTMIYGVYFILIENSYKGFVFGLLLLIVGFIGRRKIIAKEK